MRSLGCLLTGFRGKTIFTSALALIASVAFVSAGVRAGSLRIQRPGTDRIRQPVFTTYVAGQGGLPLGASPYSITAGPQKSVWFTDLAQNAPGIGKITTAGAVTEFPTQGAQPYSIVAGSDGNLWYTDAAFGVISRMTPSGTVTRFSQGLSSGDVPAGLLRARNGLMWFVSRGAPPFVGHIDTNGNIVEVQHFADALSADPSLGQDAGGSLWFTAQNNQIEYLVRIMPSGKIRMRRTAMESFREPCCPIRSTQTFAQNADGTLWFSDLEYGSDSFDNPLGKIDGASISFFSSPPYVAGLATGPNHRLWYAGQDPFFVNGHIGTIAADGSFTSFATPSKTSPISITLGPDGNLWMSAVSGSGGLIIKATP